MSRQQQLYDILKEVSPEVFPLTISVFPRYITCDTIFKREFIAFVHHLHGCWHSRPVAEQARMHRDITEVEAGMVDNESIHLGSVLVQSIHPNQPPLTFSYIVDSDG